jgi:hypothetical protein
MSLRPYDARAICLDGGKALDAGEPIVLDRAPALTSASRGKRVLSSPHGRSPFLGALSTSIVLGNTEMGLTDGIGFFLFPKVISCIKLLCGRSEALMYFRVLPLTVIYMTSSSNAFLACTPYNLKDIY